MGFINWLRGSPDADFDEYDYVEAERPSEPVLLEPGVEPDHPEISADAFLAWHAQIGVAKRNEAEYGLSLFEHVPPPEEGTAAYEKEFGPPPMAVAAPPPTTKDTWRTTQDVWVSWWRGRKRS